MKAVGKRLFLTVTGLPRSGTTILCCLLNSLSNGFCISEPHNEFMMQGAIHSMDKLDDIVRPPSSYGEIASYIRTVWKSNENFLIGGIKEVCQPKNGEYLYKRAVDVSDLTLLMVRHPVYTYVSARQMFGVQADSFLRWHREMVSFYNSHVRRVVLLRYESFCKNPIAYLNDKLRRYFKIKGELKLVGATFQWGDQKAIRSTQIANTNRQRVFKEDKDVERVRKACLPWYSDAE